VRILLLLVTFTAGALQAAEVSFTRDVRPILSDRCFTCHGPDETKRPTALRFDEEAGLNVDLNSGGKAVIPGDPAASKLIERVRSDSPALRMPPAYAGHDPLSETEIAVLEAWIKQGAPWVGHWAFEAPVRAEPPAVSGPDWVRNPIDAFVLARLDEEGLKPREEADRATLIRRATLDLTGLPPTPGEADAFLKDRSPNAYQKVVRRLLDSPHYGERMASPWLDAARYADTNGYQSDGSRSMWRWRDWVVDAFNQNKPFDEFTIEQLAGDLLPDATRDQLIATGFNRNNITTAEGGSVEEEFLIEYAADRAETTATVWLGLTVGCARCHDHKYDPIPQKDYYRLTAYFNRVPERGLVYNFGNDGPQIKAPTPENEKRLAELDAEVKKAEQDLVEMESDIAAEKTKWEKTIANSDFDAFPAEGLDARFSLDGTLDVAARRGVDDPKRNSESEPSQSAFAEGVFGSAAKLDGENWIDGGSVARYDYDDAFTASFWMKPEKLTGGVVSRMQDFDQGSGWGLLLRDGRLRFEFTMRWTDHALRVETKRAVPANEWRHVAITYTGERPAASGLTLWVDGEPWAFEIEWDDLKWPIGYRGYPFRIGGAAGERFAGLIDEVRLYGQALDEHEVAALGARRSLAAIAATAAGKRSLAESEKLEAAFWEHGASADAREARLAVADAQEARDDYYGSIPTVMVMSDGEMRQAHVLNRGAYDQPGDPVSAQPLGLLPAAEGLPKDRLGLARWLVSRENPLTARVVVNRYWQMLFGTGLVATPEDFGSQGERPSHPKLLDWLAVDFMESGWDVKQLMETIVTSATYRQQSQTTPELVDRDPRNRLLARGPRFRLSAPAIRDQALAVSGLLVDEIGGPPVKPYQPPGLWEELSGTAYRPDSGEDLYRRSLYTYWKRTVAPPAMVNFDAPDREKCVVGEVRTNTPLQALNLMNDVTYVEASRKLAERMLEVPTDEARLEKGFRLVLARSPSEKESEVLTSALNDFREHFSDERLARESLSAGESRVRADFDPRELAAYAATASLILNLDEAVTRQ